MLAPSIYHTFLGLEITAITLSYYFRSDVSFPILPLFFRLPRSLWKNPPLLSESYSMSSLAPTPRVQQGTTLISHTFRIKPIERRSSFSSDTLRLTAGDNKKVSESACSNPWLSSHAAGLRMIRSRHGLSLRVPQTTILQSNFNTSTIQTP